jgi:hypothetical protein
MMGNFGRQSQTLSTTLVTCALLAALFPLTAGTASGASSGYVLSSSQGELLHLGEITLPSVTPLPATVDVVLVDGGNGVHRLSANGTITSTGTMWSPTSPDVSTWRPGESAAALVMTPSEAGAWVVTTEGRVVTLGDATPMNDITGIALDAPVIDASATGSTGLFLLDADGGIFALGTARFQGSVPQVIPGIELDEPLVGIVVTASGLGYWLVAADGGLFAFGDAPFTGSIPQVLPGAPLNALVVAAVAYGDGYLMVASDSGVFTFSNLQFTRTIADRTLSDPVVAISPLRDAPPSPTTTPPAENATVDIWHDTTPSFGHNGVPQRWINIQGQATDPEGIATIEYRLNGDLWTAMQLGPDLRRLVGDNHFNVDILVSDLIIGVNTLQIRVTDAAGNRTTRATTVMWTSGVTAPTTMTVSWWAASNPWSVAQPVDGEWRIHGQWLNNIDDGYDRIIAIGDQTWTDYEVTVPVVLLSINPDADDGSSNGPGLGFAMRWNGHNDTIVPGAQPQVGFRPDGINPTPFGAILFWRDEPLRDPGFEIYDERNTLRGSDDSFTMTPRTTYMFKGHVQGTGPTTYRFRIWEQGDTEPTTWNVEYTTPGRSSEPASGSLALIAHEVDALFGMVSVRPL